MKKKFLIRLNVLLAALVSFLLGCKTQQVKQSDVVADADTTSVEEPAPERMICLYGIPPEVYQRLHAEDSTKVE